MDEVKMAACCTIAVAKNRIKGHPNSPREIAATCMPTIASEASKIRALIRKSFNRPVFPARPHGRRCP
jgi:hypothetical protein